MIAFSFGGKNSYDDYGIIISRIPIVTSAKRRISNMIIPGRNSSVKYDENTYEDITIAVECSLKDSRLSNAIDEVKGWLMGAGETSLIFNFQNDKKYIAQVVNSIDFTTIYKQVSKFIIVFNCRPFKYETVASTIKLLSSQTINNIGSIYSEPIIKITGNGDITLNINSNIISLKGVVNNIILDTVIQDAYSINGDNLNSKVKGEFPILNVGNNSISWLGNVSLIEITPNWRWL